ncbi:hypothetical protein RIF29_19859 [Crotalaria pallida]|uniref:DUF7036 domain-containing protein n=1 Tax=Crotalaria pallida TaxID=3830 RepID=A0AAN9F084_CROPI
MSGWVWRRRGRKKKDHDFVASFFVMKPVSLLEDNVVQLAHDIFEEIEVPSTKSNTTKVVFAVDPDSKYSEISPASISLIRASFTYLVMGQTSLQLTASLFGEPFLFDVLKFKGGITVTPQQSAFPLQTAQIQFNFTLNFSIDQVKSNFDELTSQLKSGLQLTPYENLNVILSNSEGSTVVSPTIVQSSVIPVVGINATKERLKQLAETITGPHSRNLGLNNTEFGRVKEVRLSSILQHSLHGSSDSGSAWSPSPAPLPHPHHHHHHHHHGDYDGHLFPVTSPTPAPAPSTGQVATPPGVVSPTATKSIAPGRSSLAQPPNCRRFGYRKKSAQNSQNHVHLTPAAAPSIVPHNPVTSPKPQVEPPAHVSLPVPALSPLPNVVFAHAVPPPKNEPVAEHSNTHFHGPSSSSSCEYA